MNTRRSTPRLRSGLGAGLALACLALVAGCGNDLSQAEEATTTTSTEPTRTTEATGATEPTTTAPTTTAPGTTEATGGTLPTGITLPDGTEITLPEGVDLSVPAGLDNCVEAGAALTALSLGALGVSSAADVDRYAATLNEAFGSGSSKDIDTVAKVARAAADDGQINPGAAADKAYTTALENLAKRLTQVCGVD